MVHNQHEIDASDPGGPSAGVWRPRAQRLLAQAGGRRRRHRHVEARHGRNVLQGRKVAERDKSEWLGSNLLMSAKISSISLSTLNNDDLAQKKHSL